MSYHKHDYVDWQACPATGAGWSAGIYRTVGGWVLSAVLTQDPRFRGGRNIQSKERTV